jgi:flagellar assembly protein FliH
MSSSNNALAKVFAIAPRDEDGGNRRASAGNPMLTRARVLRGLSFERGASPLETELPRPPTVVDPATAEADERRGYDDGYRAGMAEGLAAGRAATAAESLAATSRLGDLSRSLAAAADDLRRRQALELTGLEDALARAAVDLASAIIGRELQVSVSPGADALARALALIPAGSVAVARLHPADAAILNEPAAEAVPAGPATATGAAVSVHPAAVLPLGTPAAVTIIADPAVEPGGCILEVGDSRIDAQLGPALDRVRTALLGVRSAPSSRPGDGETGGPR